MQFYSNYLFTEQEFESAQGIDELPFKCMCCGRQFYKTKTFIQRYKGHLRWCCEECKTHIRELEKHQNQILCHCANCGKEIWKYPRELEQSQHSFCSNSCSATYNNKLRGYKYPDRDEYQQILKEKAKKYRTSKRLCCVCGQSDCQRPDVCKKSMLRMMTSQKEDNNLVKCGFDISTIGTPKVYDEFDRIRDIIYDLYHNHNLSLQDLKDRFDIKRFQNVQNILKTLDIPRRTFKEAGLAYAKTHPTITTTPQPAHNCKFKTGYYTNTKGEQVYYRSSYELDYMKMLDANNVDYKHEPFRVVYHNSRLNKESYCIPDFFLVESNTVVEIKSAYTYLQQDMIDKMNAYKALGYNFKLVLDHIEYDYCPDTIRLKTIYDSE